MTDDVLYTVGAGTAWLGLLVVSALAIVASVVLVYVCIWAVRAVIRKVIDIFVGMRVVRYHLTVWRECKTHGISVREWYHYAGYMLEHYKGKPGPIPDGLDVWPVGRFVITNAPIGRGPCCFCRGTGHVRGAHPDGWEDEE